MTTPTKGARKGPGRPPRADGLPPDSEAARAKRGLGALKLRLPIATLAVLDEIAETLGMSRGAAIVTLVGEGVRLGWAPKAARAVIRRNRRGATPDAGGE